MQVQRAQACLDTVAPAGTYQDWVRDEPAADRIDLTEVFMLRMPCTRAGALFQRLSTGWKDGSVGELDISF